MSERQEFSVSGGVVDHRDEGGDRSYRHAEGSTAPMKVLGGTGNNWFYGGHRGDWYQGGAGRDGTDIAEGGKGEDYLAGGRGANLLKGGGWNDILVGNQHDAFFDRMFGDNGDDTLIAGRVAAMSRDNEGPIGDTKRVGPLPSEPDWWNLQSKGNFMWGGDGYDTFVLNRDSYVHIVDFRPGEDRIVISELGDHTLDESIQVVHHPSGYFGNTHFRIILDGNIVLAEINGYRSLGISPADFDPKDEAQVQRAIDAIRANIDGLQGEYWNGGLGNDEVNGTAFEDHMWGWGGDDWMDAGGGNDRIDGGAGNDTLRGNQGDDTLHGGHGNDTLWGGDGNDSLEGDHGNDVLYGGAGDDAIFGGGGNDRIDGGAGRDWLVGGVGRDIFVIDPSGETPDIIVDFDVKKDYVRLPLGLAQADVRFVAVEEFTTLGVNQPTAAQKLVTGSGDSQKTLAIFLNRDGQDFSNVEFIWDFDPNQESAPPPTGKTIDGTAKKDLLLGTRGDDTLNGKKGKDALYGRDGDDTLNGDEGHDRLYGENGNDTLNGHNGNDVLEGGSGNDELYGGQGDDVARGGAGDDKIDGDDGDDRLFGGAGNDTMSGGDGHDRLYGGSGNDTLNGDDGADRLEGGEGNDILVGGKHDDRLIGDGGNDRLEGGKDADHLTGGEGADEFLFRKGDGVDVITDFEDGTDTIVFLAEKENKLGSKFIGFGDLVIEETDYGVRITSKKLVKGHEILLQGVTADQIDADDFSFVTIQEYNDLLINA